MEIVYTDIQNINLNSSLLKLETPNGELLVDISRLLREPVGSDNAFFNATQIAKSFNKDTREFMKNKSTKAFIQELELFLNDGNSPQLKKPIKMVKTVKGRYGGGTFFHSKLFLEFAGWLDVRFKVRMYSLVEELIKHSNELKVERENTKILFKPLTNAIKEKYIPNQISDNAIRFAYSLICDLANKKAVGYTSREYKAKHNLDKKQALRDYLSKEDLEKIKEVEKDLWGYITYANITDYNLLKQKIGIK
jgi:hypothetical protein